MSSKKQNTSNAETKNTDKKSQGLIFSKDNYILTLASLLIITIGFVLMTGKEGNIFDFRRITLAPIVVMLGFVLGIFAIFYKKK